MNLVIDHLTAGYDRHVVLHDVSASARAGTITAVIGPNAAGKSTLLRCVIGALRPMSGAVMLDDTAVHRMPVGRRARRLAYVAQRAVMSTGFTVQEVVRLGRFALSPDAGRLHAAMSDADVESLAGQPFVELSVGQQQRVMLARALAQVENDGVLVLDEPMAGMDPRHVMGTARILRECAGRGVSVIVAMHDLTLAARLADDVWLLDRGLIAAAGPVGEVMTDANLSETFEIGVERIEAASGPVILPTDRLG